MQVVLNIVDSNANYKTAIAKAVGNQFNGEKIKYNELNEFNE